MGTVKDYWMRTEFQMRGSPHVHSFWWIEGAPKADTVEGRQQAPQFVDQYISTMLPDSTADPELYRLVSILQVHRHSHTCYKHNRVTCRFNCPRPPNPATRLRTNTDPGSAAQFYVTQRNECDQWVNAYTTQSMLSQHGHTMYTYPNLNQTDSNMLFIIPCRTYHQMLPSARDCP